MAEKLSERELYIIGHSLAATATKLYKEQRNRMTVPLRQFVKQEARTNKMAREAIRRTDNTESFWKGVDDGMRGHFELLQEFESNLRGKPTNATGNNTDDKLE